MLDPNRYSLDAATVGFRKRMKQSVDWSQFNDALQTQSESVKVRRELEETPVSEIHIMGGQLYGVAGNQKTNEMARQLRQMNGYPLRSFLVTGGPITLPTKRSEGLMAIPVNRGLPQYTQYNGVVGNYASSFTEPLHAPMESGQVLLARAGVQAKSDSIVNPYKALQFQLNMHKSQAEIADVEERHQQLRAYNQEGLMKASMESENKKLNINARMRKLKRTGAITNEALQDARNKLKPAVVEQLEPGIVLNPTKQEVTEERGGIEEEEDWEANAQRVAEFGTYSRPAVDELRQRRIEEFAQDFPDLPLFEIENVYDMYHFMGPSRVYNELQDRRHIANRRNNELAALLAQNSNPADINDSLISIGASFEDNSLAGGFNSLNSQMTTPIVENAIRAQHMSEAALNNLSLEMGSFESPPSVHSSRRPENISDSSTLALTTGIHPLVQLVKEYPLSEKKPKSKHTYFLDTPSTPQSSGKKLTAKNKVEKSETLRKLEEYAYGTSS